MLCQLHFSSQYIFLCSLLLSTFILSPSSALSLKASASPSIFAGLTPITVDFRFGDSRVCYSKTVQSWFCSIVGRQQRLTLVSSLASLSWFWSKRSARRPQYESEAVADVVLN